MGTYYLGAFLGALIRTIIILGILFGIIKAIRKSISQKVTLITGKCLGAIFWIIPIVMSAGGMLIQFRV